MQRLKSKKSFLFFEKKLKAIKVKAGAYKILAKDIQALSFYSDIIKRDLHLHCKYCKIHLFFLKIG